MDFFIPPDEVDTETEKKVIKKTAKFLVNKYGLSMPSIFLLESTKYFSYMGMELLRIFLIPWIGALGPENESSIYDIINVFNNRENIELLINEIEVIEEKNKKKQEINDHSIIKKIKNYFTK